MATLGLYPNLTSKRLSKKSADRGKPCPYNVGTTLVVVRRVVFALPLKVI